MVIKYMLIKLTRCYTISIHENILLKWIKTRAKDRHFASNKIHQYDIKSASIVS